MILRDNSVRAQQAVGFFQALAVVLLLEIVLNFWYISQLSTGHVPNNADASNGLFLVHNLLPLLGLVLLITCLVMMIRWLRRAYWNLHAQQLYLAHSEGWAAGAWFVPFLNMFRPYSIVKEVWRQTQLVAYERVAPHVLLRVWWVIFLLRSVVSNITGRMVTEATTVTQLENSAWGTILTATLGLATAVLTMRVVQRIAGFEEQMSLRLQVAQLGGPAPSPAAELAEDQSDFEY